VHTNRISQVQLSPEEWEEELQIVHETSARGNVIQLGDWD
jgi:hypothetical protein